MTSLALFSTISHSLKSDVIVKQVVGKTPYELDGSLHEKFLYDSCDLKVKEENE
jgi:hypothetical protein